MQKVLNRFEVWFDEQSTQKRLVYIGFTMIFVLIFALNYYFPIYCDDMLYSVVKYKEPLSLKENLREIATFMYSYYFEWGGRVVGIGSVHLLLLFSFLGQDIINTCLFIWLVYLVYKITNGYNNLTNFLLFILVSISIFYFIPSFLSSTIWITGSGVFLLTTTLTLAFIYPYFKYYNGKEYKDSTLRIIGFFFFGILASWTNENTGPTLFLLVVGYLSLMFLSKEKKIPKWTIAGIIGVVIGCSAMILAPGNAVRAEMEGHPSLFNSFGAIVDRLPNVYASYKYFMSRLILLYILFLIANYYYPKEKGKQRNILFQSLLFFVAANIGIWITLLSPTFPPRAFMSTTVLTIVSIGMVYANIDFKKMLPRILNLALLTSLLFFAAIDYITFLKGAHFLDGVMKEREMVIDELKSKGIREVAFEKVYMDYRFEYTDYANYYKDYYDMDVLFLEKGDPKLEEYTNGK